MSIIQFGTASLNADVDSRYRAVLAVELATGLTVSKQPLPFKGYPLTLYENTSGRFSLGVTFEPSVDSTSADSPTLTWRGQTFVLGAKGGKQFLRVVDKAESTTPAATAILRGMPLAVNANKTLIVADAGLDPAAFDEEKQVLLNTNMVTIRRYGKQWYVVVCL